MLGKLRPRSIYDLMAVVAFFIAIAGGSAYAATLVGSNDIKDNSILSRHIKDGQVKAQDLAAGSVNSNKVKVGSLLGRDFKSGQLPEGPRGLQGQMGLQGPKGDTGPGAISIPITHVASGTISLLRTIGGIKITYGCSGTIGFWLTSPSSYVFVSGLSGADASTVYPNNSSSAPGSPPVGLLWTGTHTVNVDVIASAGGTTWNRIDIGGYRVDDSSGCNVWGLLIPGT